MKFLLPLALLIAASTAVSGQDKKHKFDFKLPAEKFQKADSLKLLNDLRHYRHNMPQYIPEDNSNMPKYYPSDSIDYKMKYFWVYPDVDTLLFPKSPYHKFKK